MLLLSLSAASFCVAAPEATDPELSDRVVRRILVHVQKAEYEPALELIQMHVYTRPDQPIVPRESSHTWANELIDSFPEAELVKFYEPKTPNAYTFAVKGEFKQLEGNNPDLEKIRAFASRHPYHELGIAAAMLEVSIELNLKGYDAGIKALDKIWWHPFRRRYIAIENPTLAAVLFTQAGDKQSVEETFDIRKKVPPHSVMVAGKTWRLAQLENYLLIQIPNADSAYVALRKIQLRAVKKRKLQDQNQLVDSIDYSDSLATATFHFLFTWVKYIGGTEFLLGDSNGLLRYLTVKHGFFEELGEPPGEPVGNSHIYGNDWGLIVFRLDGNRVAFVCRDGKAKIGEISDKGVVIVETFSAQQDILAASYESAKGEIQYLLRNGTRVFGVMRKGQFAETARLVANPQTFGSLIAHGENYVEFQASQIRILKRKGSEFEVVRQISPKLGKVAEWSPLILVSKEILLAPPQNTMTRSFAVLDRNLTDLHEFELPKGSLWVATDTGELYHLLTSGEVVGSKWDGKTFVQKSSVMTSLVEVFATNQMVYVNEKLVIPLRMRHNFDPRPETIHLFSAKQGELILDEVLPISRWNYFNDKVGDLYVSSYGHGLNSYRSTFRIFKKPDVPISTETPKPREWNWIPLKLTDGPP